jgi:hypothetical protein
MTEEQLHRLLEELVKQPMERMCGINPCRKWVEIPEGWNLCRIAYKQ